MIRVENDPLIMLRDEYDKFYEYNTVTKEKKRIKLEYKWDKDKRIDGIVFPSKNTILILYNYRHLLFDKHTGKLIQNIESGENGIEIHYLPRIVRSIILESIAIEMYCQDLYDIKYIVIYIRNRKLNIYQLQNDKLVKIDTYEDVYFTVTTIGDKYIAVKVNDNKVNIINIETKERYDISLSGEPRYLSISSSPIPSRTLMMISKYEKYLQVREADLETRKIIRELKIEHNNEVVEDLEITRDIKVIGIVEYNIYLTLKNGNVYRYRTYNEEYQLTTRYTDQVIYLNDKKLLSFGDKERFGIIDVNTKEKTFIGADLSWSPISQDLMSLTKNKLLNLNTDKEIALDANFLCTMPSRTVKSRERLLNKLEGHIPIIHRRLKNLIIGFI